MGETRNIIDFKITFIMKIYNINCKEIYIKKWQKFD